MKFGDNLKSIRKSKKVSQEDLADKLGVSRQSVSKWETGENYPSMQNIICLCDIFKCKMNDLVHEDFDDLDFLDEEIKMSVVKLNEKEQKNMKFLSTILFMIGRIGAICCRVAFGFVIAALILIPIVLSKIDVSDNQLSTTSEVLKIVKTEEETRIVLAKNDRVIVTNLDKESEAKFINTYTKNGKVKTIVFLETGLVFLSLFVYAIIQALRHLEKLFMNIHDGDTPFTLDNVSHIKYICYFMIGAVVVEAIATTVLGLAFDGEITDSFNLFNIIEIIFMYAIACIFEYGTKIQKDSKGKMYGKED